MRKRRSRGSPFPILHARFSDTVRGALTVVLVLAVAACDGGSRSDPGSAGSGMDTGEAGVAEQGAEEAEAGEVEATGEAGEAMSSGIEGRAVIGPSCPAQRVDEPCPERPYPTTLTIVNTSTDEVVTKAECDDKGYFRVDLPPGSYRLEPPEVQVVTAPRAKSMTVDVEAGKYTEIVMRFDSGMR